MIKKDISANLYQKCLILCSKTLLNMLHNTRLTVLLPWQRTGFQTSLILKTFLAPLVFHFEFCLWYLICMIRQAYKYVNSSSRPRLMFFELKITKISKSSGWGLEKSELPGEHNFFTTVGHRCVSCRTNSLPSTNGLCCKVTEIAPFIYVIYHENL